MEHNNKTAHSQSSSSLSPRHHGHIRSGSARGHSSAGFPPRSLSSHQVTMSADQRRDSLQKKIKVLSIAKGKIDKLRKENADLKALNVELDELNGELKQDMAAQTDIIYKHEQRIKTMTMKMVKLEKQVKSRKQSENDSVNDILYKVQGDNLKKLKYTKMCPKFVVFINNINHLFYYDQFGTNNKLEPKCIIVRDISISNALIGKEMDLRNGKPWFLIIGIKRSALFVTESISTRNKWVDFITKSIGKSATAISTSVSSLDASSDTSKASDNKLEIITSPRNGSTKVMLHETVYDGFETNAMSFVYPAQITNCSMANNGYSIQVNIPSLNKCNLIINNRKSQVYTLREFHFHTPSQYNLHSKPHEMEMHLIHTSEDKKIIVLVFVFTTKQKYINPKIALNSSKTHWIFPPKVVAAGDKEKSIKVHTKTESVISILKMKKKQKQKQMKMEESEDDETEDDEEETNANEFLAQFWNQMPLKKAKKNIPLSAPLNFDYLFKTCSDNFSQHVKTNEININMDLYEFDGCLRHPPYTEGVKWYISKKTHFVNEPQLNKLKKIWFSFL